MVTCLEAGLRRRVLAAASSCAWPSSLGGRVSLVGALPRACWLLGLSASRPHPLSLTDAGTEPAAAACATRKPRLQGPNAGSAAQGGRVSWRPGSAAFGDAGIRDRVPRLWCQEHSQRKVGRRARRTVMAIAMKPGLEAVCSLPEYRESQGRWEDPPTHTHTQS